MGNPRIEIGRQSRLRGQGIVSAIIVTHWYIARKNPAPAAITNSVFRVSGIIDPPQRPRAGTLFRLDLGGFVAFCRGLPFRVAGTLPQGDHVGGPRPLDDGEDVALYLRATRLDALPSSSILQSRLNSSATRWAGTLKRSTECWT